MTVRDLKVAPGRTLKASPVLDTYWRFAERRQSLFMRRVLGAKPPWTDDPVLAHYRFTNAYRASDRVSQYLIRHVIYEGPQEEEEIVFRTLLFKVFNSIETWETLAHQVGLPRWRSFEVGRCGTVLDWAMREGRRLYSPAYIMPSPSFGFARKHRNHLALIEHMMRDGLAARIARAGSLQDVYETLLSYRSLGPFLAFQFAIDLNYSTAVDFSEMDFVVAGPGAVDGMRKCFLDTAGLSDADVIRAVAEHADVEFARLDLDFKTLWGRPLQLIDCQNLFCELGKYARVAHPDVRGKSGRTRIKRKFAPAGQLPPQWYPPKWRLAVPDAVRAKPAARKWGSASAAPVQQTFIAAAPVTRE